MVLRYLQETKMKVHNIIMSLSKKNNTIFCTSILNV